MEGFENEVILTTHSPQACLETIPSNVYKGLVTAVSKLLPPTPLPIHRHSMHIYTLSLYVCI